MKDEHPVKWVLEQLQSPGIFVPLQDWLCSQLTGLMVPSETKMPDLHLNTVSKCLVYCVLDWAHENRTLFGT